MANLTTEIEVSLKNVSVQTKKVKLTLLKCIRCQKTSFMSRGVTQKVFKGEGSQGFDVQCASLES